MTDRLHWALGIAAVAGFATAALTGQGPAVAQPAAAHQTAPDGAEPSSDARVASLRAELAQTREALAEARNVMCPAPEPSMCPDPQLDGAQTARCALAVDDDRCPIVATQEVLEYRLRCGVVVDDRPAAFDGPDPDLQALTEAVGLEPAELQVLAAVNETFHGIVRSRFVRAYVDNGGDAERAAGLSVAELRAEATRLAGDDGTARQDRVAAIQAGVLAGHRDRPRSGELSPIDSAAYLDVAAGDIYREILATGLGPVRTRELREARGGWAGERTLKGTPRCPPEEASP